EVGTILGAVTVALFLVVWLGYVLANAWRVMKVMRLDPSDKPDNRAWVVWSMSVGGVFAGCVLAAVTWVVMEWVLRPLDPFEDSLGSIQLISAARGNVGFTIVSNIVLFIASAVMFQGMR